MNAKELKAAIRAGKRVYGTLITSASPHLPPRLRDVGLDFVFIDTEHLLIDDHDLSWMCHVYHALDLAPLVRIPEPDPYRATKVLDGGAGGVIAPYVESVEQVRALYGAVTLRPLKGRKLAGELDGTAPLGDDLKRYLRQRNEDKLLIINIESVPAVDRLDELLTAAELDAVLIGPHDLSVSMEIPEQYCHPEFDAMVRGIIDRARSRGIGVGIHFWEDLEQEIQWARHGANLFLHSADVLLLTRALREDLAKARQALMDQVAQHVHVEEPI